MNLAKDRTTRIYEQLTIDFLLPAQTSLSLKDPFDMFIVLMQYACNSIECLTSPFADVSRHETLCNASLQIVEKFN